MIDCLKNRKTRIMQRKKMDITKIFQVILTLFYGQFISSAIFDNFIRTIPDLVENPKSFYLAIKGYYLKNKYALLLFNFKSKISLKITFLSLTLSVSVILKEIFKFRKVINI